MNHAAIQRLNCKPSSNSAMHQLPLDDYILDCSSVKYKDRLPPVQRRSTGNQRTGKTCVSAEFQWPYACNKVADGERRSNGDARDCNTRYNYTDNNYTSPSHTDNNYTAANHTHNNYTDNYYTAANHTVSSHTHNYTSPNHTHTNYTSPNHTDNNYTAANYTSNNYTASSHTHNSYTTPNHTHDNYTSPSHTRNDFNASDLNSLNISRNTCTRNDFHAPNYNAADYTTSDYTRTNRLTSSHTRNALVQGEPNTRIGGAGRKSVKNYKDTSLTFNGSNINGVCVCLCVCVCVFLITFF